jgi:hypothetical protein
MIAESRAFHEGLVAKAKAREVKAEKTRYGTELARQVSTCGGRIHEWVPYDYAS